MFSTIVVMLLFCRGLLAVVVCRLTKCSRRLLTDTHTQICWDRQTDILIVILTDILMTSVTRGGTRFLELGGPGRVVVNFLPLIHPPYLPKHFEFARISGISWAVLLEARGPDPCAPAAAPVSDSSAGLLACVPLLLLLLLLLTISLSLSLYVCVCLCMCGFPRLSPSARLSVYVSVCHCDCQSVFPRPQAISFY